MGTLTQTEHYREQICKCARAMALAHTEDVRSFLTLGTPIEQVRLFTDGNLDKRFQKLLDQVELLQATFDRLAELITEYIREVPLAAYDAGCSDGDRFLRWLRLTQDVTPAQQDCIACQLARHEIETKARANRLGHVRFQELWRLVPTLRNELTTNDQLRVFLNPIRTQTTFQTAALLDDESSPPADAWFFACGSQIRTAVLENSAAQHLDFLASHGPCTLQGWHQLESSVPRSDVIEFCLDAAEMGLLAFC